MAGRCIVAQLPVAGRRIIALFWQVWKPTDKNMVGCDGCDFWIHDHCDAQAARVLASNAEEEQYFCPHCRQASAAQVSYLHWPE